MKKRELEQKAASFQWDFYERSIANYSIITQMLEYVRDPNFASRISRAFVEETPFDLCEIILKDETSIKEAHFAVDDSFERIANHLDDIISSPQILTDTFGYSTVYLYPLAPHDMIGYLVLAKRWPLSSIDTLKRELDLIGEMLNKCLGLVIGMSKIKERRDASARIIDSEVRTATSAVENVIDHFPHPLLVVDRSGHIGFANQAARSEFRERAGFLKGQTVEAILPGFDSGCQWHCLQGDLEYRTADAVKCFNIENYPIKDDHGEVRWSSVLFRDVTNERLTDEKNDHERQMDGIARLAGGIAHDFNNLLTGVLGYASLVKGFLPKRGHLYRYAEVIEKSAKRGAVLTQKLLNLSMRRKKPSGSVDINGLLEEILLLLNGSLVKLDVIKDLDKSLPVITGDEADLQHAFINLFMNANDAMPNGGTLHVRTRRKTYLGNKEFLVIEIEDSGQGMAEEVKRRLFEPFFSTKTNKSRLGMGMYQVEKVMRNHGALIELESEPDKGTCFTIYMPLLEKNKKAKQTRLPASDDRELKRILLVDDEPVIRQLIVLILEREGYEVLEAEDGERAIQMVRDNPVDLVILDMVMPGLKGERVLASIRELCPGIKVIVSSGFMSEAERDKLKERSVQHFLDKPYREEDVLASIRSVFVPRQRNHKIRNKNQNRQ